MLRRLAVASVLFTAACAGQQKAASGAGPAVPKEEKMRITNQPPFDVALCQPRQLTLSQPPNTAVITGALVAVRPEILECLVDPKNRGTAANTKVVVKTTVDTTGAKNVLSGENLTPSGTACIQAAVDKVVTFSPLAAGSAPVEGQAEVIHEVGNSPSVTFGINEGSDFSGAVRLAQPSWCECYASFTNVPPPMLVAKVKLKKGMATPAEVTFEPSGSTEGDALAACLKPKLAAIPAKLSVDELSFGHRFIHFNANATQPAANLPPELTFYQLELVRGQRSADAALTFGARANAAETYDAVVAKYQKTKDWKLVPELKEKCAALVKSADAWLASLQAQQAADQAALENVQKLKATDAAWGDAETGLVTTISKDAEDLKTAQARRQADEAACPKERKGK